MRMSNFLEFIVSRTLCFRVARWYERPRRSVQFTFLSRLLAVWKAALQSPSVSSWPHLSDVQWKYDGTVDFSND